MAKALYPFGKAEIQRGNVLLLTDDIRAVFVDLDVYTYDPADKYIADLSGLQAETALLTGKTIADDAVFDANNAVATSATGDESEAVVIFKDTGDPDTDVLLGFIDGITAIFNGGNATVVWNATGIWKM
jgi:hypothetical protein